jgi:hypothetical protein
LQNWLDALKQEIAAVAAAPVTFVIVLMVVIAAVWGGLHWTYRTVLANKDQRIAVLERRVAEYRDKLSGATADEARRRIDALEAEIETLRRRLNPRHLTPSQKQAILDRSRQPAGAPPRAVTIIREEKCSDCAAFADEIVDALRAAGSWTVTTETVPEITQRPRSGLAIRVTEVLRPPLEAVALQRALQAAGLSLVVIAGGGAPTAELLVAERAPH